AHGRGRGDPDGVRAEDPRGECPCLLWPLTMLGSVTRFLSSDPSVARRRRGPRPAVRRTRAIGALPLLGAVVVVVLGCAGPESPRTTAAVSNSPAPVATRIKTITAATSFPIVGFSGLSIGGPRAVFGELHSDGLATADAQGRRSLVPLPAHILQAAYEAGDKQRFETLPYWTSEYVHAGAFRLARYEQGVGATFDAYEGYFLGRPRVDRVVIREILDANAAYAAVLSGDVDMTIEIFDGERATTLQEQWEGAGRGKVLSTPGSLRTGHFQLAPELANPPELLDPRIRRALYLALDRKALTDLGWGGRPAAGPRPRGS